MMDELQPQVRGTSSAESEIDCQVWTNPQGRTENLPDSALHLAANGSRRSPCGGVIDHVLRHVLHPLNAFVVKE